MKKFLVVIVLVALLAMFTVVPVFAQGTEPPVSPVAAAVSPGLLDVGLLLTITAFFKERLGLSGWHVMLAAFVVGLVIWFAPILAAAFPAYGIYITGLVSFIELYLAAMGSFDLTVNVGAKIATATRTKNGDVVA